MAYLNLSEWIWTSSARVGLRLLNAVERVGTRFRSIQIMLADFSYRVGQRHRRLQEGLCEKEDYLAKLLADSSEPVIVTDDMHRLLAANPAALTLFGISKRNLNKFTIDAFLRPDQVHYFERDGTPFIKSAERLGECEIKSLAGKSNVVEFSFQADFLLGRHLSRFRNAPRSPTAVIASRARQAAYAAEAAVRKRAFPRSLWFLLALLAILVISRPWLTRRSTGFDVGEQMGLASEKAYAALGPPKRDSSATELVSALNLFVVDFPTASAQLPPDSAAFLDKAAVAMKAAPAGTIIEIDGNTDNRGDPASNMTLSQKRANAVRHYLVQQGVDPSTLTTKGNGDTKPVASNDTKEGRLHNRRIQFIVVN